MLLRILNKFFNLLSLRLLRLKWKNAMCRSVTNTGEKSMFHQESRVFNLQNNRTRIKVGRYTHIRGELLVFAHGGSIEIGDYCYVGESSRIWSANNIRIGNRVLIAHNVNIHDNNAHPRDAEERHRQQVHIITKGHPTEQPGLNEKPVLVSDDAWIGFNATVLKGVTIGKGAIVGACSVVTKDVPDHAIVAGNPAVIIGHNQQNDRHA